MRIISWNLGHQTREAKIAEVVHQAIRGLIPDVVVLNEFVDGPSRGELRKVLASIGLPCIECSGRQNGHNQILIAARESFVLGELKGPDLPDGGGQSNFLHVRFTNGIEIVGLRAPTYRGSTYESYWAQLVEQIRSTADSSIAWIGDLNADPDSAGTLGGQSLAALEGEGWCIPRASGPWSFYRGSRIDHVIVSRKLECSSAEYVTQVADTPIAGAPTRAGWLSDHAVLVATLVRRERNEEIDSRQEK